MNFMILHDVDINYWDSLLLIGNFQFLDHYVLTLIHIIIIRNQCIIRKIKCENNFSQIEQVQGWTWSWLLCKKIWNSCFYF